MLREIFFLSLHLQYLLGLATCIAIVNQRTQDTFLLRDFLFSHELFFLLLVLILLLLLQLIDDIEPLLFVFQIDQVVFLLLQFPLDLQFFMVLDARYLPFSFLLPLKRLKLFLVQQRVDILVSSEHCFLIFHSQLILLNLLLRLRCRILSQNLPKIIVMHYGCFFVGHLLHQVVLVHFVPYPFLDLLSLRLDVVLQSIVVYHFLPKLLVLLLCQIGFLIRIAKRLLHSLLMHLFKTLFPFRQPSWEYDIQNTVCVRVVDGLLACLPSIWNDVQRSFLIRSLVGLSQLQLFFNQLRDILFARIYTLILDS